MLAGGHSPARPVAIRVLIAFIGAVQGSLYSVTSFVDNVLSCYRQAYSRIDLAATCLMTAAMLH